MLSSVHFLNVRQGDCILLRHNSGRSTIYDICAGNIPRKTQARRVAENLSSVRGNFQMCHHPTNPLDYLQSLGLSSIWRFILSHPDMDHLDGFDALMDEIALTVFWDSRVRREKPDFQGSPYLEEDWKRHEKVRDGEERRVQTLKPHAGNRFKYANINEDDSPGGDGLHILAPDPGLVEEANKNGNLNDASYVLLYRSVGGRVVIPGDAHDKTWKYVLEQYEDDVRDIDLLVAPHHGRKSGRSYDFLDVLRPKLTLFGCARSEYLAYDAWNRRGLKHVTNNQAGCIVAECFKAKMDVYVENEKFADAAGGDTNRTNSQGFYYWTTIEEEKT